METPIVISASRRTDIPAFYMDWFMSCIEKGEFSVKNPFNGKISRICATADSVHTIVFWSKDFGRFVEGGYGRRLSDAGYNLFFNFTVNSESSILEPNIMPLGERLSQAEALCSMFGPETVQWRFDPVCFYEMEGKKSHNLWDFETIAEFMAGIGITRCITSFADIYTKLRRRTSRMTGFSFIDPPLEKKILVVEKMSGLLERLGISLYTCCEKDTIEALGRPSNVEHSACIPNRYLVECFGGKLSFRKDAGQRRQKGCGCMASRDIGSYDQPCFHNCLFCYANPATPNPAYPSLPLISTGEK